MRLNRRSLLAAGVCSLSAPRRGAAREGRPVSVEELDRAANAPVLRVEGLSAPVEVASMELLRNGREYLVRVRDRTGAEASRSPTRCTWPTRSRSS